jgi:hypothetical protein
MLPVHLYGDPADGMLPQHFQELPVHEWKEKRNKEKGTDWESGGRRWGRGKRGGSTVSKVLLESKKLFFGSIFQDSMK